MGWNTINDDRNRFDEIRLFDQVDILVISLVVGLVIGWLLGHFVG
jgi:F0F1-type ATP synthase assembly protein I